MAFTSSYTPGLIQQSEYYYGTPEMTPGLSGSFSGSFQGDGSALTGISSTPFPFIGDAEITGSLIISGSNTSGLEIRGPIKVHHSGSPAARFSSNSDTSEEVLLYDSKITIEDSGYEMVKLSGNLHGSRVGVLDLRRWTVNSGAVIVAHPDYTSYIQSSLLIGKEGTVNSTHAYKLDVNGDVKLGNGTDDSIEILGPVTASTDMSSSAASTASFGSFVGNGNNITNISPSNITYGNNIAIGGTVTDTYGVAIGKSATSAGQAVAIGGFSSATFGAISLGQSTNGGNYTVAVGMDAGHASGQYNVLLGYQAGKNSSGNNNIAFGYRAGFNQTTGTGNITIGSGSLGIAGESNQLRIGNGNGDALISGSLSDGGVMIRGQVSASSYIGDGSGLTNLPSIYTSDGNILSTRTINDRAGGFTGTAGSNALKMNVRNSGALLVAGYQNNGDPGTTNHLIQWGPGATDGSMNVRGKLGLTGGGGRIDLTNSGGSQYFTVAQTGITSTVSLSATTITNNSAVADTKLTGSFTGSFVGDGSNLTGITATAGSTAGRVVFTTTNGELTSETGFTYDATTDRLTVPNLTTTTFTASFITSSQIHTSGSNIFGDDTTDTQTLIGTTLMTGSAQISGSLTFGGTAPTDLYSGGPKRVIDTSAVGGIKAKGALFLQASADSSYNSRILFGTTNSYMSFGRRGDNSTAIRGVTQNYAFQLFGITQGLIGSTYTTNLPDTTFADNLTISGSGTYMSEPLKVHGSGSSVFEVIGTEGTLFSVDDDLDGTLLDVKDRSGIPVLQASASGEIYLGQSPQSLYTTAVISSTIADVTQSLYRLDTSSYGGAFFDYIAHSGSNARGGTVSSVWTPGGSVVFSETTTTHIGDTSNLNLVVHFSQSQAQLACYADTSQYNIKVITRAI